MDVRGAVSMAAVVLAAAGPAYGQGISEYGSLLGAEGKPGAGLHSAVQNIYSSATHQISGSIHGIQQLSSPNHIRPTISDPSELAEYGKRANESYLSARQLAKAGKTCEAIRQYSNALLIRERIWGDSDPAVAELLKQQSELYMRKGNLHDCENNYRKLLAINVKRYGPGSKETDNLVASLAALCEQEGDNTDALTFYRQLVAIRTKFEPADSPTLKTARLKLATQLTLSSDYPPAEQILKQAIAAEDASPTPDTAYLCKCLDVYGGLLRETYHSDEAAKIEQRQKELEHPQAAAQTAESPPTAPASTPTTTISAQPASTPPETVHR